MAGISDGFMPVIDGKLARDDCGTSPVPIEEFLRTKLYRIPGLRHSRSSFVLRRLKNVQAHVPQ